MRLNKYIASCGICSRRKADELVKAGNVKINGAVVLTPGTEVAEGDLVVVNGRQVKLPSKFLYYALNKPCGFVTTMSDEKGRPTVASLLADAPARVFPVGRLDMNTSGLLLMTNDGEIANKLSHPSSEISKTYLAEIGGSIKKEKLAALQNGVDIGDKNPTAPAEVELLRQKGSVSLIKISIREGRNRQIRRMFKALGLNVLSLQRVAVGEIQLGHLLEGSYRKLNRKEIEYLKRI
ncbi:MAG: rRNA pseudouridine synthase [Clostridiales bacterium]|nr:rRNA pseudouridine synthase [Clostridiales bacterium]